MEKSEFWMYNKKVLECAKYFKENPDFKRIFSQIRVKWKQYGRVSGYIVLENPTASECKALSSVIGNSFDDKKIKFKMSLFEKALSETKFSDVEFKDLLEAYFNEKLTTNKEEKNEEIKNKTEFLEKVIENLKNSGEYSAEAEDWLNALTGEKSFGYNLVISEYNEDERKATEMIINVCKAVNYLKGLDASKIRLAVLAAFITTKPHYFDRDNSSGKLLIHALSFINSIEAPKEAEKILELYYLSNIIPDGISSFTTAYGIRLYTAKGLHKAYEAFIEEDEEYLISLSNLNKITNASCRNKVIFIVENQMVFSELCDYAKKEKIQTGLICTSGQMKTASLILIDLLLKQDYKIYYSGDIDPEGILIADNIIKRSSFKIIPWGFGINDYYECISDKKIEDIRLRKIENLQCDELKALAEEVLRLRKAGYQELLLEKMKEFLLDLLGN